MLRKLVEMREDCIAILQSPQSAMNDSKERLRITITIVNSTYSSNYHKNYQTLRGSSRYRTPIRILIRQISPLLSTTMLINRTERNRTYMRCCKWLREFKSSAFIKVLNSRESSSAATLIDSPSARCSIVFHRPQL